MKTVNLFSYIGKFNPDGAKRQKIAMKNTVGSLKTLSPKALNPQPMTLKNSLPDPIKPSPLITSWQGADCQAATWLTLLPKQNLVCITVPLARNKIPPYRTLTSRKCTIWRNATYSTLPLMAMPH